MILSFTLGMSRMCQSFEGCFANSQRTPLFAKFSKCELWLKYVDFLRHILSNERIRMDSQKIEVVKQWPRPTSPKYITSFKGLTGY